MADAMGMAKVRGRREEEDVDGAGIGLRTNTVMDTTMYPGSGLSGEPRTWVHRGVHHRVCPQADSGTIDIFFLASSPHFSHPHGICHYLSTTVGAHRGADRGFDWSKDPDGIFL